jgi:AcrR family transcriptional regulator
MSSVQIDTKTRILEATVRMLEAQQGRGVRMGDIAKTAGISRQAIYLHFPSRAELLVATTMHLDQLLDVDRRLAPSRAAKTGTSRLALYIECWGNYIPEIYGVSKALLLTQDTDEAAATAWRGRMMAMRDGCRAAIEALHSDGTLTPGWTPEKATDVLWTMLLVPNWENFSSECGWSTEEYIRWMKFVAEQAFVKKQE